MTMLSTCSTSRHRSHKHIGNQHSSASWILSLSSTPTDLWICPFAFLAVTGEIWSNSWSIAPLSSHTRIEHLFSSLRLQTDSPSITSNRYSVIWENSRAHCIYIRAQLWATLAHSMQSETQKRFLKQAICPQMLGAEPAAHRQGQTSHQGTKAADACRTALEQNVHPDLHTAIQLCTYSFSNKLPRKSSYIQVIFHTILYTWYSKSEVGDDHHHRAAIQQKSQTALLQPCWKPPTTALSPTPTAWQYLGQGPAEVRGWADAGEDTHLPAAEAFQSPELLNQWDVSQKSLNSYRTKWNRSAAREEEGMLPTTQFEGTSIFLRETNMPRWNSW